ncbi:MAG: YybS family protein [Deltaproteobacteria bacterium]|nr:YybS family protein [Deltaproteobacteria bacterium]
MKTSDVLGCAGGAISLLLASVLIPFVGPFFSLLTPLPFLYYSTRLGLIEGIKLTAVVVTAIGLIAYAAGYSQITLLALEFSVLGIGLAELFRRKLSLGNTIFLGTLFMLFLGLGMLVLTGLSRNLGPIEMILGYLGGHLDTAVQTFEDANPDQLNTLELNTYVKAFMAIISQIYPSLMIIGTGFALWLNVVIARPLFKMGKLEYPEFISMDRWQAPDHLVWGLIGAGFALFLASESIQFLALNALIVILAIYLFHGLSIIIFFLNKYRVPSWIRLGIYFLIIVQQLFLAVLTFAGLFDQWIDFRKIHRRADSQPT